MITTNMNDLLLTAAKAAQFSDRVLFIASLIVMGLFAIAVARFFIAQYQTLTANHQKDRENFQVNLQNIITQQNDTARLLATNLERNTEAFKECTEQIRWCKERNKTC